jgi:hypothetical protein
VQVTCIVNDVKTNKKGGKKEWNMGMEYVEKGQEEKEEM